MALKEIEYGSLASSADLNNNFLHLDNRISQTTGTINTSISSILSNIATINSRLSDLAEDLQESVGEVSNAFLAFKVKALNALNKVSMIPNWAGCSEVTDLSEYRVNGNGYLLILPGNYTTGNLIINQKIIEFNKISSYNEGQILSVPVCEGDIVSCECVVKKAYFIPVFMINYESDE